jgi:hypothetical protein
MQGNRVPRLLAQFVGISACLTVALFTALPAAYATTASMRTTPHTEALWHMDETSGTTMVDSSGHGHTGTTFKVTKGNPGFLGKAYHFDGKSSEITVGSSPDFNVPSGGYQVTVHVKFGTTPQSLGEDTFDLIRKGLTTEPYWKVEISKTGKAECHFTGSTGIVDFPGNGPLLNDNVWHTILCWKTTGQLRLFVDGALVAYSLIAIGTVVNSNIVTLGFKHDPNVPDSDFYKGTMDEVSIVAFT